MKSSSLVVRFYFLVSGLFLEHPFVALGVETNDVSQSSQRGGFGQGFYIPEEHLLSSRLTARGSTIFDSIPEKCIVEESTGNYRKEENFYKSTKSLYSAISTNTGIELNLQGQFTMGASIQAVTNNVASKDSMISGSSLQMYAESKESSLSRDCINDLKFKSNFIEDFRKLNKIIQKPWLKQSWRHYKSFLKKYGSHVVKTIRSGSSLYQYQFAETDKAYSERNFTVKACASLAGPTNVGELGLSACSSVTKDDIKRVSDLKIMSKLVVRGGKADTRAKLVNKRDKDSIEKFLQEGKTDPAPIVYKFIEIWDLLQAR